MSPRPAPAECKCEYVSDVHLAVWRRLTPWCSVHAGPAAGDFGTMTLLLPGRPW